MTRCKQTPSGANRDDDQGIFHMLSGTAGRLATSAQRVHGV
jgi:hypothetical protein